MQQSKATLTEVVHYELEVVRLTGVLILQTFPGPPNYEFDKVIRSERCWILKLDKPIAVAPARPLSDGLDTESFNRIDQLQLVVLGKPQIGFLKRTKSGIHLDITGTLFESHTGHHHTRVLITVQSLSPVN